MDFGSLLKQIAPYIGIGGIGLVAFYYLFRDFIQKSIFPQLPPLHAFRLLRLFLVLVFAIAALALVIGVVVHQMDQDTKTRQIEEERKAAESREQDAQRKAWQLEQQKQLELLRSERESIERRIEATRAAELEQNSERENVARQQAQKESEEARQRLRDAETERQRILDEERQKIEAERAKQQKKEEEAERRRRREEEKKATHCCDIYGTKRCRIAPGFSMDVGENCGCYGIPGAGEACR